MIFSTKIDERVGACDIALVLIGSDKDGNRRFDNPDDFVRLEIAAALRHEKTVAQVCRNGKDPDVRLVIHDNKLNVDADPTHARQSMGNQSSLLAWLTKPISR